MSCGSALGLACPNCAAELPSEAQFCFVCGQKVGAPVEEPAPAEAARIEQYIPAELLAKLESARTRGGMQGERRVVTMLFCDVKGSTATAEKLDPEEWADIMNGAFEHLISPVYAYEGTLARLMGDAILAFFGAPIAHEDDPQRAVLAGLEILAAIEPYKQEIKTKWGFDFDVRVGINTGLVVVGEVGSDLRVEYTALGDAVNLAARMEQAAEPGTVLISEQTHKLIAPMFEFEAIGDIEVKGKTDPISAFRVLASKAEPGQTRGIQGLRSPIIGRAKEIDQLREAIDDLRRGRGQIIALMGEAGIGKSRLTAEMREEALAEAGVDWFEGRSVSYQTHKPYAPFTNLFSTILGIPTGASDSERHDAVVSHLTKELPSSGQELAPYIESMLGVELPSGADDTVKYLEPNELHERIFGAVSEIVAAMCAKQPTVLVFEDLHWADPTSVELVEHLMPLTDSTMLMLVGAFRPERQDPSWNYHETATRDFDHRYTSIELKPLDENQTDEMCTNLLQVEGLPDAVRALILNKTEGNPFFVEEVIRSLLESGSVVQDGDRLRATTAIEDIAVPETLSGVLTTRLDQLDEASKQVAQTASVIGREFGLDLLRVIEDSGSDLEATLMSLQRRGLIRETSRVPRRVFMFKHALTQETSYESLLLSRRRVLHKQVADWLQEEEPERVNDIGRHLLDARENERALPYLVVAGDEAAKRFSMREAIGSYRRAVSIVDAVGDLGLARQTFEGLGMTLHFTSQIPEALATYKQMEEFAEKHSDGEMLVSALNKQSFINALRVGDIPLAEAQLVRSEEISTAANDEPGMAEMNMTYCQIRTAAGELEDAYDRLQVAAEIGRKLDLVEPKLYGMVHVANTLNYLTRFDEAKQAADDALTVAKDAGHLGYEAELISLTYPFNMMSTGDIAGGLEMAERGAALSAQIGSANNEALGSMMQGMMSRLTGDYERAIRMNERAARVANDVGLTYIEAAAIGELGNAYLDVSPRYAEKTAGLHMRALQALKRPLGSALGAVVWGDVGFCAMSLGKLDEAVEMFKTGLEAPTATKIFARPQMLLGLGIVSLMRGEIEEAFDKMEAARANASERGMVFFAPIANMALGMFYGGTGQPDKAVECFDTAEELATTMGMLPTLWQTRASASGVLRGLGRAEEADEKKRLASETIDAIADRISDATLRSDFVGNATAKL